MWLLYGILGAFSKGFTNLYRKRIAGTIDTDVYLWLAFGMSIPLIGALVLIQGVPITNLVTERPLHILANSSFWILALIFNVLALKKEELSYISPLSAFTPLFTLLFAWALLGEIPPAAGLLGMIIIFAGAYVINLKPTQVKWYEPLTHLYKNSGARFAMGVALCFGIVSVITRTVTNDGYSPVAWLFVINVSSWLLMTYVPFKKRDQLKLAMQQHLNLLISVSVATVVAGLFGIYSIATAEYAVYAIGLRRLDIIFSIILGWKLLDESNIRIKIIGGTLMTVGVLVVSLF